MIVHLDTALNLNFPDNDNRLLTMIICGRDNKICIFIKFLVEKRCIFGFLSQKKLYTKPKTNGI